MPANAFGLPFEAEQIKMPNVAETDYAIKKGLAQPRIAIEQFVLQMASL